MKVVAYMYGILYVYNGILWGYPAMVFYHLRGSYEWISNYLPVHALFTIVATTIAWYTLRKFRNF